MKLKTIILSAIAVIGMATPRLCKDKGTQNTDNNVSSDTEQVAEHDMNVYGANYTDGDKVRRSDPKGRFRPYDSAPRTGGLLRENHAYYLPCGDNLCGPPETKTLWRVSLMERRMYFALNQRLSVQNRNESVR